MIVTQLEAEILDINVARNQQEDITYKCYIIRRGYYL